MMVVTDDWAASFCLVCEQSSPGGDFCSPSCCITNYQHTAVSSPSCSDGIDIRQAAMPAGGCIDYGRYDTRPSTPAKHYWNPAARDIANSPNPAISDLGHFRLIIPMHADITAQPGAPSSDSTPSSASINCYFDFMTTVTLPKSSQDCPKRAEPMLPEEAQCMQRKPPSLHIHGTERRRVQASGPLATCIENGSRLNRNHLAKQSQLLPWEISKEAKALRRIDFLYDFI